MGDILQWLKGKKTYAVAILMIVHALSGWALGENVDWRQLFEALGIAGLRSAIRTGATPAITLLGCLALLSGGCATRYYKDPSGAEVRSRVPMLPFWDSKAVLGEFSMRIDTNGVREIRVLNHSSETTEKLGAQVGEAAAAFVKAYAASAGVPPK